MSLRTLILAAILSVFLPVISWGGSVNTVPNPTQVKLEPLDASFSAITDIAHSGDSRLFVVEQGGTIQIVENGVKLGAPFLTIPAPPLACCGERGLLGLAFHPSYATNGYFYVNYTYTAGSQLRSRISRFSVSAGNRNQANASSELVLLEFDQPETNHNGGALHFGPDGYLYIASGDGGGANDPPENAQNMGNLLGKILRIDVNSNTGGDCNAVTNLNYGIPPGNPLANGQGGACDEIWAYGLRNPWRISFDRKSGDLWIADVGQGAREEIDFQPGGSLGGQNYGWDCWEGTVQNPNDPAPACRNNPVTVPPLHEYDHGGGRCSITGGYVYRGSGLQGFEGAYFFADYCSAELWTLRRSNGAASVTRLTISGAALANPRTFGEDAAGELYVASPSTVYRLVDPSAALGVSVVDFALAQGH